MKQKMRLKLRLIVNIVLTVISLSALVITMIAWFSNNRYTQITNLELSVDPKEFQMIEYPDSIILPCATKLNDVTEADFNNTCIVVARYELKGEVNPVVSVKNNDGLLGFVWDEDQYGTISSIPNYHRIIHTAVENSLGNKEWSYDNVRKALSSINRRSVGKLNTKGNTDIYIVFWGDYEKFDSQLNATQNDNYVFKDKQFFAELSFVL